MLLYERDTGTVVFSLHGGRELPIASLTKLMTTYATVQYVRPGAVLVEQPYSAGAGESLARVPAGTRLGLLDALRAMLLPSGNDVAHSLAVDVAGSVGRFVSIMNLWARLLRLRHTHFVTPIGLDRRGNHSTARDLARLADVLLRDPLVARVVSEPRARLADGLIMRNLNDLLGRVPWIVGVKTGHTARAGYCMVGAARLHGVHLISVVLGARTARLRDADTLALLRYGFALYHRVRLITAGRPAVILAVKGRRVRVRLVAERSVTAVVARSAALRTSRVGIPRRLVGPLPAGTVVGRIEVRENGRLEASVPLVTATRVPAPPPPSVLGWIIGGAVIGALLLGCSLPVMRRRVPRTATG